MLLYRGSVEDNNENHYIGIKYGIVHNIQRMSTNFYFMLTTKYYKMKYAMRRFTRNEP